MQSTSDPVQQHMRCSQQCTAALVFLAQVVQGTALSIATRTTRRCDERGVGVRG